MRLVSQSDIMCKQASIPDCAHLLGIAQCSARRRAPYTPLQGSPCTLTHRPTQAGGPGLSPTRVPCTTWHTASRRVHPNTDPCTPQHWPCVQPMHRPVHSVYNPVHTPTGGPVYIPVYTLHTPRHTDLTSLKFSKAARMMSWPPRTRHTAASSSSTSAFVL